MCSQEPLSCPQFDSSPRHSGPFRVLSCSHPLSYLQNGGFFTKIFKYEQSTNTKELLLPIPAFLQPFHRTVFWLIPKAPSFSVHLYNNEFHSFLHHPHEYFPWFPSWSALTLLSLSFGSWTPGLQNLWFGAWGSLRSRRWQRTRCPSHFSRKRNHPCTHRPHSATLLLPGTIPAAFTPPNQKETPAVLQELSVEISAFRPCSFWSFLPFFPADFPGNWNKVVFGVPPNPKQSVILESGVYLMNFGLHSPLVISTCGKTKEKIPEVIILLEVWVVCYRLSPLTPTLSLEAAGY